MGTLSSKEVEAGLSELAGWEASGDAIAKEFELESFREAVAFVVRLSFEAEAMNHHPDVDLRYNRVTIVLSTHSEGGVTDKDLKLAAAIEALRG
jgi:4a-hydroxytetrahydrobiopterin dehydratase